VSVPSPTTVATAPSNTTEDSSAPDDTTPSGGSVGEDVSGPCDEAEHATDPRCTGATPGDDHFGPGSAQSGRDDDDEDDDHSGRDRDDDDEDDHSGRDGDGGDDDDGDDGDD
jgi:hypothetical protein